jgi:hypothetical protein
MKRRSAAGERKQDMKSASWRRKSLSQVWPKAEPGVKSLSQEYEKSLSEEPRMK